MQDNLNEDLLSYVWKFKQFETQNIITSNNKKVQILNFGTLNKDSGPDYFNAKIKVDDIILAGNVEIHISSSDWFKHKHHLDKSYDNIILHVVYNDDKEIKRQSGEIIPTLELKNIIFKETFDNYNNLINTNNSILCYKEIKLINEFILNNWLERLSVERIERKSLEILSELNNNNWEQLFYEHIAKNFGFKVNALPFELLAKSLPLQYLGKHKNSLHQIEALLFGQAGMLYDETDDYCSSLYKEYSFLKSKFNIKPLEKHLWKFMRIRPSNFPTIRISQFANLIYKSSGLFSKVIEIDSIYKLKNLLDVSASTYWDKHYNFGKQSKQKKKTIGESSINNIIINTIIPIIFAYGKHMDNYDIIDKALLLQELIPSENNSIIKEWKDVGIDSKNANDSQALIQLKNEYCNKKKCLNCNIGNHLLKRDV